MTEGGEPPQEATPLAGEKPYPWNDVENNNNTPPPPAEVLQLWTEVGNGIDKNQTVVWKSAVESLDHAHKFLRTSAEARYFVEKYMGSIIGILSEQLPAKIGHHERNCVQESLALAVAIVAKDLDIQIARGGECLAMSTLSHVFTKKKPFYKGGKGTWNVSHLQGLPEVRLKMIERFRTCGGFVLLHRYMLQKIGTPAFPKLDSIHQVLQALGDVVPSLNRGVPATPLDGTTAAAIAAGREMEDDAILVCNGVMQYINSISDDGLKKLPTEQVSMIVRDLQRVFDRLVATRRSNTYEFYSFWRALVLKLISSQSLPLKLFGWEQVAELIDACAEHRPPPRSFMVIGAGCTYVNGIYDYAAEVTEDGYARPTSDISYVKKIVEGEEASGTQGRKLTLFRCTMRSQQKWWFLSEADEEQPGTDRDIDYYQHKSKEIEETYPPATGWITCRASGVEPPPTLEAVGLLVPPGEEMNTLEHQLARWAIENEIVEQVLGDTTIHREVVARSTNLIKFLASMCNRDKSVTGEQQLATDGTMMEPNKYCLQASHLLYAWKTCTRKADAAVSLQVYQLLVSILPLCPAELAVPLLRAVQKSLEESHEKRNFLQEVSEFCSALAALNPVENVNTPNNKTPATNNVLSDEVREEALNLLWAVLTHPDAHSLKSYDSIKRYVTYELRVEPRGSEHRERFLKSCLVALSANARIRGGAENVANQQPVDEVQALRMVKLTHFVLDACPRQQATTMVTKDNGSLPLLLFHELTAYLERRTMGTRAGVFRKTPSKTMSKSQAVIGVDDAKQHWNALHERLRILRHIYGLSDPSIGPPIVMTPSMLETLWVLCDAPDDREALMVFIASASHGGGKMNNNDAPALTSSPVQTEHLLSAAFTEEVCHSVFLNLFCSPSFSYDQLGDSAYRSFQFLFNALRLSPLATASMKRASLDALWRVCLTAGRDSVASQAMRDLLSVYVKITTAKKNALNQGETMLMDEADESFGDRMFQCLAKVKRDLDTKDSSANRSADRSLHILNAAIGQADVVEGFSMTASTLARLSFLTMNATLDDVSKCLPHGMRGQGSYRRIGVIAKRPQVQNTQQQGYQGRDNAQSRLPSTMKFTLDVHPLETILSVKYKVALNCQCPLTAVKPIQINGRSMGPSNRAGGANDPAHLNLNVVPEDSVMDELGVVQGCEMVFVIAERPVQANAAVPAARTNRGTLMNDMSSVFFSDDSKFADQLFDMLLAISESLPWVEPDEMTDSETNPKTVDAHRHIWDLLLAMPTNASIAHRVKNAHLRSGDEPSVSSEADAMEVEASGESWSQLLDAKNFNRSVYVLITIDAFLQPALEALSIFSPDHRIALEQTMIKEATTFRRNFIDSGGFNAVVRFFSASDGGEKAKQGEARRGNAVALRILKSCLFGDVRESQERGANPNAATPDEAGSKLLQSLSDAEGLLKSLTAMVVYDGGISSSTITDVLRFLRLLFRSPRAAESFVSLPDGMAERFLLVLLRWEEDAESRTSSSISASMHVRRSVHDLILQTPLIADHALPWLIKAVEKIDVSWDNASEHFDALEKLVADERGTARSRTASDNELRTLAKIVCKKLPSCPRPTSESEVADSQTGVLCGCLKLLRALIETGGGGVLHEATEILVTEMRVTRWSTTLENQKKGMMARVTSPFTSRARSDDTDLIDLMGAIFDGFLCPGEASTVAICCDKESRHRGFDVVGAAARSCKSGDSYLTLVNRINGLISSAAPNLRHKWGQFGANIETQSRSMRGTSRYSGLRNQGCTCYMNSVLQQLFMMPELRASMCSAPLPVCLRESGGVASSKGAELVGKKITLQWDTGVSYDAIVEGFDAATGMHTIRYCPIQVATVGGANHHQIQPDDIFRLPPTLPDEFVLSEGRPGKETGVFELVNEIPEGDAELIEEPKAHNSAKDHGITESEDESSSRHLLEEVQRTFIHLQEGSKGRCFDPRVLVEACACLKLEFDVWQQNDASEFATKLLDRLEISLKRWAPGHFRYLDHTFGLKQTKQKICKECGLKTNREEKLMNIDCQIRGKSDIHEALAAMTEVEIMEGSNKVFCDNCKKNTDTILRTAISTLPNMLILSLKRFDLDYNTFETVKLNSRCAFGQTLNMKHYTLEGLQAVEKLGHVHHESMDPKPMDTDDSQLAGGHDLPGSHLPDEDYEYRLAGVLVHAGVAQGGHYYSFIKDRNPGSEDKWYRFDDEDVTPFDPALIENECFGGRVKKETKWPNGQVHTVEQEQFANALMLFYEKVTTTDPPAETDDDKDKREESDMDVIMSSGYDVFEPDVRRSNATHRWQAFLFDVEFHSFLKGLLGICRLSTESLIQHPDNADDYWRPAVVQMLLSFLFDVYLYGSERGALNEWTRMLEETLWLDAKSSRDFVEKLAKLSRTVSSNWLRTYLLDCPEQSSRAAAVRVFAAAMKARASSDEEYRAINAWTKAWREQLEKIGIEQNRALPCSLESPCHQLEDVQRIGSGGASSIGIIISFINELLEALPRCWRFSAEVCTLIRSLADMSFENGEHLLRRPMIEALIPARLIALAVRDRAPGFLRIAFPGASVPAEVANTQMRAESSPNAHVMPLSSNQVLNASDMNNPRGPVSADYIALFEALACLAGLPGVIQAPVVQEAEDTARMRPRYALSEPAVKALTAVFNECCALGSPGMGQREIESYLHHCGVDTASVSTQKILDMLQKYPTTSGGNGTKSGAYLSLEGFLAYYRDTVQTNDMRVRLDLHTFGFRPDMTRRSHFARYVETGERESERKSAESVAIDVAEAFKDRAVDIGTLGNLALMNCLPLYNLAYNVCEPLAEYLVAAATYRRDADALINQTLQMIYRTPNDWGGTEAINVAVCVLMVIASTPGDNQDQRIAKIMQSSTKAARNVEHGGGLLQVARAFHRARQTQHYSNEIQWGFERYMNILKDLRRTYPIYKWMSDNREAWNFIERELTETRSVVNHHQNQIRGDYGSRDAENSIPLDHHSHTDSDMAAMNDSEEEDEDSQFDQVDSYGNTSNEGPFQIIVDGAGNPAVNGAYSQDGYFETACRYVRDGRLNDNPWKFYIFQCNVSNNTKHWYISIVPHGNPGTSADIDFYTAPATTDCMRVPPTIGWVKAQEGRDPAPKLTYRTKAEVGSESPERIWNASIDEDENQDGQSPFI